MPVISKNSRRNNRPATRGRAHQSGVEGASVSPNPAELELSSTSASSPAAPFVLQPHLWIPMSRLRTAQERTDTRHSFVAVFDNGDRHVS
ncbi:hypothetical protein PF004_g1018 [Phytophthora fragariae]|uniref:Uncharacterized protein n=1 Tax=Phytophthora fragariae TaxID=53985 RepID=A0A6G0PTQ5_9STRA|nr:hypothetical protein PF003_g32346 [Phytophthora fragariae]KAE9254474.1 hypothetical protein PF004_g1018 [Phytophthora fragariae]